MTWLKLDASLPDNGVWQDWMASRLWMWILCRAKTARVQGTIRFSYPVVSRQMAGYDGTRLRKPSHKTLRRALRMLEAEGRVTVAERAQGWEQVRAQGGAQGYLTVSVCNWDTYQHSATEKGTGSDIGKGTGMGEQRAREGHTKEREREKDIPVVGGVGVDLVGIWNAVAGDHGLPSIRKPATWASQLRTLRSEERDDQVVRAAFELFADQDLIRQRRYGFGNFYPNRKKYLERAQNGQHSGVPDLSQGEWA